ncbi:endolytic transglycosylase MltG [Paenibacillus antri]|uniref:Endolytic transglycosylase MltG n=1 Tax=Paenibacillus antri TaxID=2582848 RepID=A0A5R9G1X8_9BACL|nr:endolytic transglycosylase MltG [Paenibacillus antri]TLS49821.1 endolytic transglycosylase MltG [Paenibacillus antri]
MASRKTYLYGLGTGLIAGSLLLQLASIGQSATSALTEAELQAAATAGGYVLKDARMAWFNESEVEARVAEAVEKALEEAAAGAGDEKTAEPAEQPAEAPPAEAAKIYAFTIAEGTELTTVAKLLYELGLVSDYNGFLIEMDERGLAGKIQAKHYRFDRVPTMDELIEALITP